MAKYREKDDSKKAAVMAALMAGQRVSDVAKEFNVPHPTVIRWRDSLDPETLDKIGQKREEDFGAMLGDYLKEILTTLKAQQQFFRNENWLQNQSASEVAVLHGVTADKGFSILEAIERAHAARESAEGDQLS